MISKPLLLAIPALTLAIGIRSKIHRLRWPAPNTYSADWAPMPWTPQPLVIISHPKQPPPLHPMSHQLNLKFNLPQLAPRMPKKGRIDILYLCQAIYYLGIPYRWCIILLSKISRSIKKLCHQIFIKKYLYTIIRPCKLPELISFSWL